MGPFQFDIGDIVRSTYRSRWIGIVTDRERRKDAAPLYTVRPVLDRNGQPIQKAVRSQIVRLDEAWLTPYEPRTPEEAQLIEVWSNPAASRSVLRDQVVRLAYVRPDLRPHLLKLLLG